MLSSRGSSWPKDWTRFSYVSCIAGRLPWDSPIYWKFSISAPYPDVHYRNVILCFHCLLHFSVSLLKIGIMLFHLYDPRTWYSKGLPSQGYRFSSSHVWVWELDYKESRMPKNWCFWTVVLEKTLESPLDYKEIQPVNSKRNQSWIFFGRTDAEAEAPILWPPVVNNWLIRKNPEAGKDWRHEEKGMTEDEMAEWHHWLSGYELEQAGDAQGGLLCCSPWGCKESDTTEQLNWTELNDGEAYAVTRGEGKD